MARTSSPETRLAWEAKVQQQRASGLSINRWCREQQIRPSTFHYWKEQVFVEAPLNREHFTELADPKNAIVLEYQGIRICLEKNFDPVALKQCLLLLQELQC